jgi:hypothetical protein
MKAQFITENIDFKRGIGSKAALDVGEEALLKKLTSTTLAALDGYQQHGIKNLLGFESIDGDKLSGEDQLYIIRISDIARDFINFGAFHISDDNDKIPRSELDLPENRGKKTYWVFGPEQDGFVIAYSTIKLPNAGELDRSNFS